MRRQAKQRSQRGLLLVEAILSAVIIGIGLVFITRALAGQLASLRSVRQYDTLLDLAEEKLGELESQRLFNASSTTQPSEGIFAEPFQSYHWRIKAQALVQAASDKELPPVRISVTVWQGDKSGSAVSLSSLWPASWVSELWF